MAINSKEFALGIFLDLSKAFNTVGHTVLLDKLDHQGFQGIAFKFNGCLHTQKKQNAQWQTMH